MRGAGPEGSQPSSPKERERERERERKRERACWRTCGKEATKLTLTAHQGLSQCASRSEWRATQPQATLYSVKSLM